MYKWQCVKLIKAWCNIGGSPLTELETSCLSLHSDHFWYDFVQVWDISLAFCSSNCRPDLENSIYKLVFRCWLYFSAEEFLRMKNNVLIELYIYSYASTSTAMHLQFMPQIFYWISIWALRGGFPPVDGMVHENMLGTPRRMFGIVILHESMSSRINISNERKQVRF